MAQMVCDPSNDFDYEERFGVRSYEEVVPVEVRATLSGVAGDRTKRWMFLEITEPRDPDEPEYSDEGMIYVRVAVSRDELHELKRLCEWVLDNFDDDSFWKGTTTVE